MNFAFIDNQNIVHGLKSLGWAMDWRRFRVHLRETWDVAVAYIFIGYVQGFENMYRSLQEAGYVLIFKPTIPDPEGHVKGNIDAELVLQAMIDLPRYAKAIVISSDGDFACLVRYLRGQGKLGAVLSPHVRTCSALLKKAAGPDIFFMDNLRKKLEYKRKGTA